MKDQIFIGWSGSNEAAVKVKRLLEAGNYKCTIGGNADNNSQFSSVGDTVIQQIRNCNQAIMIFKNRADGQVSNNLFFELGYVLAMYGQPKVHCVRRADETVVLPSDFDNSFVEPIACGESDDEFAENILAYFTARQKMSINTNKMVLINNRYKMHDYIQRHFSEQGSGCSDYELAQYMLFYVQAAHMFGDERKVLQEITRFKNSYHSYFSEELAVAVNMGIAFFEMVLSIKQSPSGDVYLERADFRKFRDRYNEYGEDIVDDDTGTFDEWARVFIAEHLTYAYILYATNPDLDADGRRKNTERGKACAERTIAALRTLDKTAHVRDNNDHRGIVSLLYAYVYRNLFLLERELGDEGAALVWLEKTKKERTALKNNFESGSIDTQLYENFAMEYYLSLIEYLNYADKLGLDEDDVEDYEAEIAAYVADSRKQSAHSRYVDRIDALLSRLREKRAE